MKRLLGLLLLAAPLYAQSHEELIQATLPKVVVIHVTGVADMPVMLSTATESKKVGVLGSGSVISSDGFILTCDHLFEMSLKNREITVKTTNGREYNAVLVGEDKVNDLALIRIFPMTKLPYFTLGPKVRTGQKVLAFGAPLGIAKTVTIGYVSNTFAKQKTDTHGYTMHTALINPGNSGGPLVNLQGQLVGVNVANYLENIFQVAQGMCLAVLQKDIRAFLGGK